MVNYPLHKSHQPHFYAYAPHSGDIPGRCDGAMISQLDSNTVGVEQAGFDVAAAVEIDPS